MDNMARDESVESQKGLNSRSYTQGQRPFGSELTTDGHVNKTHREEIDMKPNEWDQAGQVTCLVSTSSATTFHSKGELQNQKHPRPRNKQALETKEGTKTFPLYILYYYMLMFRKTKY